jgi:type I thyroxine 5'-deiodinase
VLFANPKNDAERAQVASSCVRKLGLEMPALVDGMDNSVERSYTGWPDRLYVIDRDGKVAYKSKPGPFGFHPKDAEAVLKRVTSG